MPFWDDAVSAVSKAAVDVGGAVTNTVAPALQTGAHAVAAGACHGANAVTGGQIKELKGAADDQQKRMEHCAKKVEAGFAHLTNKREPWFKEGPGDMGAWMSGIPDSKLVTDLFLPGTHDSGARHGGDFAECQTWTIEEQLRAGIRCFDIRLRQSGDALAVHHGQVFQKAFWGDVRSAFEDFLSENPSEVIFASITDKGVDHDSKRKFKEHLISKIPSNSRWASFGTDLASVPIGNLRGRVVGFMCPFNSTDIEKQDDWECGNCEDKWEKVWCFAREKRAKHTLYVNFCSAVGADELAINSPAGVAFQVNKKAYEHMKDFKPGVIMMDYPGKGIVSRIVEKNF